MDGLRAHVKRRLDRRYGLTSELEELRREIANLDGRYAESSELDQLRKELNALRSDKGSPPPVLAPSPGDSSVRLDIFQAIMATMKPGKLLDLGAGHGKFAELADEMGWSVTAVDARTKRFPDRQNIQWAESDVRDYEIGDFDVISMLGIFYHLEAKDQLDLLRRCSGTITILDTHVALMGGVSEHGYDGHLFSEKLEAPTASWINEKSFWPTEESLVRMLHDTGYRFVFKLIPPPMSADRTWYICY